MNVDMLITAIVRQTTVLIAQLATTGTRSDLASVANDVFRTLVEELKEQGLSSKAIADIFGLSLRTYYNQVKRLSESQTRRGSTLWEQVLKHIQEEGVVSRDGVLETFHRDDEEIVRGVLNDLIEQELIYQTGGKHRTRYRAVPSEDMVSGGVGESDRMEAFKLLVRASVFRLSPCGAKEIGGAVGVDDEDLLEQVLSALVREGTVGMEERGGRTIYLCDKLDIPVGAAIGWEAAVFDHFQAMVMAISAKLNVDARDSAIVGGCTYTLGCWQGHPMEDEILGTLDRVRSDLIGLKERLEAYNDAHPTPTGESVKTTIFYAGQMVRREDWDDTAEQT